MVENFSEYGIIIPENSMREMPDKNILKQMKKYKDKVVFQTNSDFHDIFVCDNKVGRFLKYGISIQAGIIDTPFYKGNIPYLNYFLQTYFLKPNAKKILLIGFGIGHLVNQMEKLFQDLIQFDSVDIEENIMDIASNYFDFKPSDKFNFYLQDALVFLRNNKTKYDIIITDVAGNEGIDERFFKDEFFGNIKKSLVKDGILAFNSFANTDFDESENTFFGFSIKQYKKFFKNFAVFNGVTSDTITLKTMYGLDKRIYDITNSIFIASDMVLKEKMFQDISLESIEKINSIDVNIYPYAKDLYKIYKARAN